MSQILEPIIDILRQVLIFFNGYINSWGWSIILLTVIIKIVLLPLTIKQTKSMESMKKWQPEIKKLQEKYKNDKEKLGQETMKFYSENKINPFGGCLPLLLQLPVFFALFRLLGSGAGANKEMFAKLAVTRFLGISSLTAIPWKSMKSGNDLIPFGILIILMVISQYFMQKMMSTDPQQEKMLLPMTAFMVVIGLTLPAGVLIYWVTFNILAVVQQYFIAKNFNQPKGSN